MTAETEPLVDDRRLQEAARRVVTHHFGAHPTRVLRERGGRSNYVYRVSHPEGDFMVRLGPEPRKLEVFRKERWATEQARELGIPVVEVLEVGETDAHPYSIAHRIRGEAANYHPERTGIAREMGRIAAQINSIPTTGFGYGFQENGRFKCTSWREHLDHELKVERRLDILERHRMLGPEQLRKLRTAFGEIEAWTFSPALSHGDLRMKNVLVNACGRIVAILDWEHCISTRAPYWEFSVALHDRSIDEKEAFLAGYGLPPGRMVELAPAVKAFNILNYAPEIERLAEAGYADGLEQYRTRLGGALDLYSL